jgi:lysine-specific demethylase 8
MDVADGRVLKSEQARIAQKTMRFGEFLDALLAGRKDLYLGTPVDEPLSGLMADIRLPSACEQASWLNLRLWVGPGGIKTALHHDLPDNLLVQFRGRKHVILIPRKQGRDCYPYSPFSKVPNFSRVDAERPDLARFPRFARVTPISGELEAGDVLFIPRLWWHQVRSVNLSISLNLWYANGLTALAVQAAQRLSRFRGAG